VAFQRATAFSMGALAAFFGVSTFVALFAIFFLE
jgi:hypothetical protein